MTYKPEHQFILNIIKRDFIELPLSPKPKTHNLVETKNKSTKKKSKTTISD